MSSSVYFRVYGTPVPQGSKRAFVTKTGKAVVVESGKNHKSWRQEVAQAAVEAAPSDGPWDGPIGVGLTFLMPRPKSAPKGQTVQAKRPDIDKLTRSILDSLTGSVYKDDGQVCALAARKVYASDLPGVEITVYQLSPHTNLDALDL